MRPRPGFARLLPLMALTGVAAGTLALLASARPAQAPEREPAVGIYSPLLSIDDRGCSDVAAPVPSHGIIDAGARRWELTDIPGHTVGGLFLQNAEWFAVDLHSASLFACDFQGADLRNADLRGVELLACDFTGADLTDTDLSGATYDTFTRWPAGFDPQAHGAHLQE
jgi:hypothetical protein